MNSSLVNLIPVLLIGVTVFNAIRFALQYNSNDLGDWLIGDSSYGVKFCLRLVIIMPLAGILYLVFWLISRLLGFIGVKYISRKIAEVLADK